MGIAPDAQSTQWWKSEGRDAAHRALTMINQVNQAQVAWHADNLRHTRMYENRDYFGTAVASHMVRTYSQARRVQHSNRATRMSLNVTKAAIDTLVSKLGKERVKPIYLTTGGIIERRERCDKLNQWIYGQFELAGVYRNNKAALRNSCVYGKGGLKTFVTKKDGKPVIMTENVFIPEILIDPYDAYYGNPLCLYQQKFVTKDFLRNDPVLNNNSQAIDQATSLSSIAGVTSHDTTICWEAWRRKTEKNMGSHIIFTDGGILFQEDWDDCEFPMDFIDYTSPVIGFWGVGVAEELIPIQIEINRISNHIRDSMILCANPRTFVPIGAQIDKNHLTNKIGGIIPFAGSQPPIQMAPPSVARESFEQLENLYRKAFEIVGLNLMSASGRNTLGASASGEAIRSYNDVETERFAELQQNWEAFHCRVAQRHHKAARSIVKEYGHYVVSYDDDEKGVLKIDFADIDIPDDAYSHQVFPKSALPTQPGFRLATVKEMKDEGYIDQDTARELMDFPDIKMKSRYQLAPRKVIEKLVEAMAYQETPRNGKWKTFMVEPYMNLAYAMTFGAEMYNYLLLNLKEDTDEHRKDKAQRLNLIRGWIDQVDRMAKLQAPPPSPAMGPEAMVGGMGAGGAMGMPPQALSPEMAMGPQIPPMAAPPPPV